MSDVPTIKRTDEYGHVAVEWPDPPRRTYEMSHDLIAEIAKNHNAVADLRQRLHQSDWIVCAEALRILDGTP